MLPRSQRLSKEQLQSVIEKGRIIHSPLFLVRVFSGQVDTRIAVVAPKKTFKLAVTRNMIRRKVCDAIGIFLGQITTGTHIAIFAKPKSILSTPAEIEIDLKNLFVKAGLLR